MYLVEVFCIFVFYFMIDWMITEWGAIDWEPLSTIQWIKQRKHWTSPVPIHIALQPYVKC